MYDTPLYSKYNWGYKFARSLYGQYKIRRNMAWGSNFQRDYAKMRTYVKPTPSANGARLAVLERKVRGLKPERKHFFFTDLLIKSAALGFGRKDGNITTSFHGWANFRDNVLGDKWKNHSLKLALRCDNYNGMIRLVVYYPKRVGDTWSPTNIGAIPDPNDTVVLYDRVLRPDPGTTNDVSAQSQKNMLHFCTIPLGNRITIHDGNVRRNELRYAIMTHSTSSSLGYNVHLNGRYTYSNV